MRKNNPNTNIRAIVSQLMCSLALGVALMVSHKFNAFHLISHTSATLLLIWVIQIPIVILIYSQFRHDPCQCSYAKAFGRGLLGLLAGALVNGVGAIALGAPVGVGYLPKTINWCFMMSLFTFVPAASVFGSSWTDWQRLFAYTEPRRSVDYMICLSAHGAIIGAWFGAWPMPLDWERPWQEWPICVSYGAIAGYMVGMLASIGFILLFGGHERPKTD